MSNSINNKNISLHTKTKNWDSYKINMIKSIYPTNSKIRQTELPFIESGTLLVKSYAEAGIASEDCKKDLLRKGHSEEYCDRVISKSYELNNNVESKIEEKDIKKSCKSIMIKGKYFIKK